MKLSEANKRVRGWDTSIDFIEADMSDGHGVVLRQSGRNSMWMSDDSEKVLITYQADEVPYESIKLLYALHETPAEEREDEKNFRVFISNGMNRQRLVRLRSGYIFCDENGVKNYSAASYGVKDIFTKSEVDRLRSNGDFNISWDKALEEVPGDEVSDD
ncbi:hypothetical protein MUDAN_DOGOELCO_02553 [Lactiplantibacillus mudanjiangensis]|uniref:hypothetical protein n=1 Tax=Lactiplantibacillus mudanjiangensis TaxID=1296538 RepID=UPI001014CC7E|nr:hypothetical protein [Lactiplantibacillus mudanjiangensis]VDG33363.1 hypothetical protein MUDAN_DOGOELCO_02553 [Lactiplantibacillus mudanjiangensis]